MAAEPLVTTSRRRETRHDAGALFVSGRGKSHKHYLWPTCVNAVGAYGLPPGFETTLEPLSPPRNLWLLMRTPVDTYNTYPQR